jgi:transcription initiation factor TFIIIB Brf1 subunit/transcription initiation factor TFIIB
MPTISRGQKCLECLGSVVDAGEELVCSSCGIVTQKEVLDSPRGGQMQAIDFTGQALGGYLGSAESTFEERHSGGLSGSRSSYVYLKLLSDYAGREDSTVYACAKTIERACDLLALPRLVMAEAVVFARRLLGDRPKRRATSAAVSAFAIVTACKVVGGIPVGARDVIETHRAMGKRVRMSDLIQLSLDAPSRLAPRKPRECMQKVVARLGTNERLLRRLAAAGTSKVEFFMEVRNGAARALDGVDELSKAGHNPWALAATALYVAELGLSDLDDRRPRISQRDVALAAGVAEYTVREQYKKIFKPSTTVACRAKEAVPLLPRSR